MMVNSVWPESNGGDIVAIPEVAAAELSTLRLRLWKEGALVQTSVRRIWFHVSALVQNWVGSKKLPAFGGAVLSVFAL
jgi:hypothetical protein